jgi:hypothetical protein
MSNRSRLVPKRQLATCSNFLWPEPENMRQCHLRMVGDCVLVPIVMGLASSPTTQTGDQTPGVLSQFRIFFTILKRRIGGIVTECFAELTCH